MGFALTALDSAVCSCRQLGSSQSPCPQELVQGVPRALAAASSLISISLSGGLRIVLEFKLSL